jgi:ATP-dependent protease HslVU (ClpYQ) peptidase subunit
MLFAFLFANVLLAKEISMTTIIADSKRKIMVSDSKCTYGDTHFRMQKIYQMPDGTLIGFSGSVSEATKFVNWWIDGANIANKPNFGEESFDALVLDDSGINLWDSNLIKIRIIQDFFAVGSGAQFALGALRAGADPVRAVEIAAQEDNNSGLPIDSVTYVRLDRKKISKKRPPVSNSRKRS